MPNVWGTQWARLLGVSATSGVPLISGLVVLVTAIVVSLFADTAGFLPGWADPLNFTLTATLFMAPMAAGAAAAHATWIERSGIASLLRTTARGRNTALGLAWSAVLAWQWFSYFVLAVMVLAFSDLRGAFSPAMLLLPASALALLAAATSVGLLLGATLPSALTAPAVTVAMFMWLYAWGYVEGRGHVVSPTFSGIFYQPYLEPNVELVGSQALASSALVLLGLAFVSSGWRRIGLSALTGIAALVAGLQLSTVSVAATQFRSPPEAAACAARQGVRVCVWPDSRDSLEPALRATVAVVKAAKPYLDVPRTYRQPGLGAIVPEGVDYFVPALPGRGAFLSTAVDAALPSPSCGDAEAQDAWFDLNDWLAASVSGQPYFSRRTLRLVDQSPATQRAWVQSRLEQLEDCHP